jgi:hypothetical protein
MSVLERKRGDLLPIRCSWNVRPTIKPWMLVSAAPLVDTSTFLLRDEAPYDEVLLVFLKGWMCWLYNGGLLMNIRIHNSCIDMHELNVPEKSSYQITSGGVRLGASACGSVGKKKEGELRACV